MNFGSAFKPRFAMLLLMAALWAAPAFGQGCAMCYTSALGTSPKSQQALSRAVTVLLVPPVGMMTALVGAAFVYARKRDRSQS
jgi:hypothetical protein